MNVLLHPHTGKLLKYELETSEKQLRKEAIDRITRECALRAEEFMPRSAIDLKDVRKTCARIYDQKIKAKIIAGLIKERI